MSRTWIASALERARADAASPAPAPADGHPRSRRVAVGDPQAPLERFLEVLDVHGLLGDDGRLRPEVLLVSMGDHFDWGGPPDRARAARSGLELLAWLAAHPADQVILILGNHDLGRVCELADFDEGVFARILAEADPAYRGGDPDPELEAAFRARHPHLTGSEVIARDLSSFHPVQRELVTGLLRNGRFRIAHAHGEDLLLCHAGVTRDDLARVGVPGEGMARAPEVAAALNAWLAGAVARWSGGALQLEPLHRPGRAGEPGGRGILYQRPAHPDGGAPDEFVGPPRRRFDPRLLPPGLTQAVGHIRDAKCRALLGPWAAAEESRDGPLRFLRVEGDRVHYARGVPGPGSPTAATVLFLDGGMIHVPPHAYELLDVDARRPLPRG